MTPPGPACESLHGGLGMCVGAIENTHPSHRDALKSCIRRLGPQALCDERIANQCLMPYFHSLGVRRTVSQPCQQAGVQCGGNYSAQVCEGLHAAARPGFNVFPCDEGCGVWCMYTNVASPPPSRRPMAPFGF